MALPFISAPGPWYSASGQGKWSCPYGVQVTYGNGVPPYHIFFTNSTIASPVNATIGPSSTMEAWGPSNEDPGMHYYTINDIPLVFGDLYHFALQDANKQWAYSGGVIVQDARAGKNANGYCQSPPPRFDRFGVFGLIVAGFAATILLCAFTSCISSWYCDKKRARTEAREAREARTRRETQANTTIAIALAQVQAQAQAETEIEMEPVNKAQEHVVEIQFEEDFNNMAKVTPPSDEEAAIGEGEFGPAGSLDGELPGYHA